MSEINLWNDACKKSWNKARPFDAPGNAYEDNRVYDKAIEAYRKAIKLNVSDILQLNENWRLVLWLGYTLTLSKLNGISKY